MELTGAGLKEIMIQVHNRRSANKDEEVMRAVKKWEDDDAHALRQGMPEMEDLHKITILEQIATDTIREKREDEIDTKYNEARSHLMR